MFGAGRRGGRLETQPLDSASGPHRSGRSGRFDRHIKLVAARGLVGLARSLLRTVGRAYRAGYLDLAPVECCLRVSAKLRSRACGLIATKVCMRPRGGVATRPSGSGPEVPAVTFLSHSQMRGAPISLFCFTLLLTNRVH
jgi:hypothetical protein